VPGIHHVGLIVPPASDFDETVAWWAEVLQAKVVVREALTTADPTAIGLPDVGPQDILLEGAQLQPNDGGTRVELHRFVKPGDSLFPQRRTHDVGLSHIAVSVDYEDLRAEGDRLEDLGVRWLAPPQQITTGVLNGVQWRYGEVPREYGDARLELTTPSPIGA